MIWSTQRVYFIFFYFEKIFLIRDSKRVKPSTTSAKSYTTLCRTDILSNRQIFDSLVCLCLSFLSYPLFDLPSLFFPTLFNLSVSFYQIVWFLIFLSGGVSLFFLTPHSSYLSLSIKSSDSPFTSLSLFFFFLILTTLSRLSFSLSDRHPLSHSLEAFACSCTPSLQTIGCQMNERTKLAKFISVQPPPQALTYVQFHLQFFFLSFFLSSLLFRSFQKFNSISPYCDTQLLCTSTNWKLAGQLLTLQTKKDCKGIL